MTMIDKLRLLLAVLRKVMVKYAVLSVYWMVMVIVTWATSDQTLYILGMFLNPH